MTSIDLFTVRWRLPQGESAPAEVLDGLVTWALDEAFEVNGIPDGEEIAIARVDVAPQRIESGSAEVARAWAEAVAAAVARRIAEGGPGVVRYPNRVAAVSDLVQSVLNGDTGRMWAWRRLGLPCGGSRSEIVCGGLLEVVGQAPALVAAIARAGRLDALVELLGTAGLSRIADAAWRALGADPITVGVIAAGRVAAGQAAVEETSAGEVDADEIALSWSADQEMARGRTADDEVGTGRAGADEIAADSVVADGIAAGPVAVTTPAADEIAADRIAADRIAADGIAADQVATEHIATGCAAAEQVTIEQVTACQIPSASEPRPAQHAQPNALENSPLAQFARAATDPTLATALAALTAAATEPAAVAHGRGPELVTAVLTPGPEHGAPPGKPNRHGTTTNAGVLFFLHLLDKNHPLESRSAHYHLARELVGRSAPDHDPDDPALLAFCGLPPNSTPPGEEPGEPEAEAMIAKARARLTGRELASLDDTALLRAIVHRRGEVTADPGWIEIELDLDEVSVDLRAAGFDLDPGWVPALGCVVRFRYV